MGNISISESCLKSNINIESHRVICMSGMRGKMEEYKHQHGDAKKANYREL